MVFLPTPLYRRETKLEIKVVKKTLDELLPLDKIDRSRGSFLPSNFIRALFHRMYDAERFLDLVVEEQKELGDNLVTTSYCIAAERLPPRIDYIKLPVPNMVRSSSNDNVAMIKYSESIDTDALRNFLVKRIRGLGCEFDKNILQLIFTVDELQRVFGRVGRNVFYVSPAEASFIRNQDGWFLDRSQYESLLRVFGSELELEREFGRFRKAYIPHPNVLRIIDLFDQERETYKRQNNN